jgi:hypothetical protein
MSYQNTIGESNYSALQTKVEQQFSNGLYFLFAYTWSKTTSDAGDLLNGGSTGGFRAPYVPGLGPSFDRGLADFDLRQVLHFSGIYNLPFGNGQKFGHDMNKVEDDIVGGWSVNWIASLQGGQPINFGCPDGTAAGLNCNTILVKGSDPKLGLHKDSNGVLNWIGNAKAFNQPCQLIENSTNTGVIPGSSPGGCIPLTGAAALGSRPGQIPGPGFHRLDFSTFKSFHLSERWSAQFRADFFNILNHPNFNSPNFGGNGVVAVSNSGNYLNGNFGEIGSTRDDPLDPRQIQFALKLYF